MPTQSSARAPELIGRAPEFLDALAQASAAAAVDRPILIVGERGSGKELLAARLHFLSPRWESPLVTVNCAAMNEELLESELFGHEAGAFTGAAKAHRGRFERAEGGTLFLDEIASSSPRVQEKLLRVIEYGDYERLGGERTMSADVRIIAAANVDLRAQAKRGDFRADLLDRLAFDVIVAPPLRRRREDIPLLAAHFAAAMAAEIGAAFPGFSETATQTLLRHDWPGNVRELKNVAERALYRWVSADRDGPIERVDLDPFDKPGAPRAGPLGPEVDEAGPSSRSSISVDIAPAASFQDANGAIDLRRVLHERERALTEEALINTRGNQKQAADMLSLTYDQLRGVIKKHELNIKSLLEKN